MLISISINICMWILTLIKLINKINGLISCLVSRFFIVLFTKIRIQCSWFITTFLQGQNLVYRINSKCFIDLLNLKWSFLTLCQILTLIEDKCKNDKKRSENDAKMKVFFLSWNNRFIFIFWIKKDISKFNKSKV